MCGIAGIVNYQHLDLTAMMESLRHRGPDDQTIHTENQVALIHTRLAIQDVQNGTQPFHFANYSIIFNGEIYNHQELRARLHEFSFQTQSDTETLLYLFIKFKYKMFDLIDGMFAFCIYDKNANKIILARDRAGKKPLYFLKENNRFLFASELNAIKTVTNPAIFPDAINCYLRAGYIWQPYTAYKNVFELEASSYLILDLNTLSYHIEAYFSILDHYHSEDDQSQDEASSVAQLETLLKKSISDRIKASDVEVGVFLSGGIDSNLIAALAAQIKPDIKTFTVKFDGLYDESSLALLTAKKYKTKHIELTISSQLCTDIEKILSAYGEPFMDSSAIPSYYVSQEASKYVKVALSGDGADELFAGYRRYVPVAHSFTNYVKYIAPLLKFLPKPHVKQSLYTYLYRLIAMADKKGLDFYLSATTDVFEDVLQMENGMVTAKLAAFIQRVFADKTLSPLKRMLYADFSIILFGDLLVKMDIAAMANSLEVRSPFLSKYLLEFAPGLADKFKINRLKTKYILRQLAEKYLSPELVNQPKRGFEVPLQKWVEGELHTPIHDNLRPGCYSENFVERKFIQDLLNKKIEVPAGKRAKILWAFYCLEVWQRNDVKYNRETRSQPLMVISS